MLSIDAPFPCPGSRALLDDRLWRVLRLNPDDSATIYEDGTRASGHRTVALADLTDPASRIALREDAPLAVRFALDLRDLDAVRLTDAIDRAQIIKAAHTLPHRVTPARVRSMLEDLGWHRGIGPRGPIVYLRARTTMADAGAPAMEAAA